MASTYLMCFICGRKFGSSSLLIHQKTCRCVHEKQQASVPAEFRKELPEPPPLPKKVTRRSAERFNEQVYELYRSSLMHSCTACNRAFSDYHKLIAHRRRCDRLAWANNPLSAAVGGSSPGSGNKGGVLSWKSRNSARGRHSQQQQEQQQSPSRRVPEHLRHDLSSSFDDSNLSSSPTSVDASDGGLSSPRSGGSDDGKPRDVAAAVGSAGHREHVLQQQQQQRDQQHQQHQPHQPHQQHQRGDPMRLSASGNQLFQLALKSNSGGSGGQRRQHAWAGGTGAEPPSIPKATPPPASRSSAPGAGAAASSPPPTQLPGQQHAHGQEFAAASVFSLEVEQARREYHRHRLQLKAMKANSSDTGAISDAKAPATAAVAASPAPAGLRNAQAHQAEAAGLDGCGRSRSSSDIVQESSPEARATMARLKAMYSQRRAKLKGH